MYKNAKHITYIHKGIGFSLRLSFSSYLCNIHKIDAVISTINYYLND